MRYFEPVLYTDENPDEPRKLPTVWEICASCGGEGTTTRHIECDGGGFTASEWAEACDDDPDFAEDYFGGRYDRPCPDCNGSGKVKVVDLDRLSAEDRAAYEAQCEEDRWDDAMRAAERRMGA